MADDPLYLGRSSMRGFGKLRPSIIVSYICKAEQWLSIVVMLSSAGWVRFVLKDALCRRL